MTNSYDRRGEDRSGWLGDIGLGDHSDAVPVQGRAKPAATPLQPITVNAYIYQHHGIAYARCQDHGRGQVVGTTSARCPLCEVQ